MDLGLQDKAVLVLAGSGGIGRGVATEFAREGARVVILARSEERLQQTAAAIEDETGHRPACVAGDVAEPGVVERAVATTVELHGGLWALFNNTGGPPAGTFDSFDDGAWQSAFDLTLLSYVRAIRAALPHMRAGGGGRIVSNASVSTKQAVDSLILSNVFRSGVQALGKSLARELGSDQILVNTVGPARIDTDRIVKLDHIWAEKRGISVEEQKAQSQASIPLGRYGTVEEFGRTVVYLASPANGYVTGQNILIDGGMVEAY